jgi:RimJ/RimL family protein N-acetyltransferase
MTRSNLHTRPAPPPLSYVLERRVNQPVSAIAPALRDRTTIAPAAGFALGTDGMLVIDDLPRPATHPVIPGHRSWRTSARLLSARNRLVARVDIEIASWGPESVVVQMRPIDRHAHRWGSRRARRYFTLAHAGADTIEQVLNAQTKRRVAPFDVPFTIRPIEPDDREALRSLFWRLSPESRYFRFLAPVQQPTEQALHHLAEVDHARRDAIVAVVDEQVVGVARYDRDRVAPANAEIAVVVEDAWHRHGIATALVNELSKAAHRRGIEQFTATVAAENRAVATFVRSFPVHATWAWDRGERQLAIPLAAHIES